MKVNVESLSSTERKVEVFIPVEEVREEVEKVFKEFQKNAKVSGFRPGKVPRKVIESIHGGHILEEVSSNLVSESFKKALDEVSLIPVSRPRITPDKIERDKEFRYTLVFEVIPEFEVKDYVGIELKNEKREVKEEDVERTLNELRERAAEAKPLGEDREVQAGDYVIIDYEGFLNGKSIEDLKRTDIQFIVGEGELVPEFEDNIVGMRKGEEKEFEVAYAEDFQMKDVAGRAVKFSVKIKGILERILPELNDEFIKDLGEKDLESLKKKIREDLEARLKKESEDRIRGELIKVLLEKNPVDIPPSLIENEAVRLKREFAFNLQRHGLEPPKLNEEAEGRFRERAIHNVKTSLILGAIARKEGIKVEDEEVDNRLMEISKSVEVSFEKIREFYEKNNMISSLEAHLVEDKVLNFLIQKSNIEEASEQVD